MAKTYDLITVGGGLGGAALAGAMAERGARVLVLERETKFKDRVRGEALSPWGVDEARQLGIYDMLLASCGHEPKYNNARLGSWQPPLRDFIATTRYNSPFLCFYHPAMQEAVLGAAAAKGAEIQRGVTVSLVEGGQFPEVTVERAGTKQQFRSRLAVGADGRTSRTRHWGGFEVLQDPERNIVCGLLMENMTAPADTFQWLVRPERGEVVVIFPQRDCTRAYFAYQHTEPYRLSGHDDIPRFIEKSVGLAPAEFYQNAKPIGPLASFSGADTWVEHPYRNGVVLMGDAAGASDPTYGQGLALTLRDARVLRDHLLLNANWNIAADAYAEEHARYYRSMHLVENWLSELLMSNGPAADARRDRALSLIAEDPSRFPDHVINGPDLPADEPVRQRLFGEI